ncbi:DEAD/DEAH box helicase family protein [Flavobacterium branchiophilum]|uniref:DNA repair helicase n=1 Tax=Flavobacterium branchiophilum TaxID=55197 RepID=A0A2H3K9W1_9FLAO|nr:DEAD/DEAH box helicase family protein [Flavobacterium branchiophilum]PDS23122.1 DNA repair helicase [Flavobacterium branchiophilum]
MLKDCDWSIDRDYKTGSENEPLQFYLDGLANSNEFNLLLGYFSSSAINLLSVGFATFISKGGKMKMVINHLLSAKDKEAINQVEEGDSNNLKVFDLTNSSLLHSYLDEYDIHFFECLTYLISQKRIEIKVIKPKNGKGIAHYKSGVFSDGENNVGYKASCNFTLYGLSENLEELEAFLSWENGRSNKLIKKQLRIIDDYFNERDEDVDYLPSKDIEVVLKDRFGKKDINELLVQEEQLLKKKQSLMISNSKIKKTISAIFDTIEIERKKPRFPYPEGPRPYQIEAYMNWVKNDYIGLFAMATGTGKTLTSLNCVLEEYKINNFYKFIVLVPTTALAKQWVEEANKKFNYQNTILCCSENNNWKSEVTQLGKNILFGREVNYGIITTYATFKGIGFQTMLKEYFDEDYKKITLIADEAHNFGSQGFLKVIPHFINKRIGLSATPERQFDDNGNKLLNHFFSCSEEGYTFEYNMKTAIENGILCKYFYYPVIVNLEQNEQENYLKISKELLKYLDFETGKYKESEYVNNLLIKRKNIIHKAKNKLNALLSIINKIGKENFKRAFIYLPEGIEIDNSENEYTPYELENETRKIIDNYLIEIYNHFQIKMAKFTGETNNRDQILNNFKDGNLDALLAMKCLDEGVDVPQTKYAIFCSSTGNPRQYIQRRGRVLRTHKDKEFAIIYDLIVKPSISHTNTDESLSKMEKNIFLSELRRLVNFAVLSENKDQSLNDLESLCNDLDIDIYELANKELDNYK